METYGRPTGKDLTISKQRRTINQQKQTIEHLHERLAAVQSSKRNKASQIARLHEERAELLRRIRSELDKRNCITAISYDFADGYRDGYGALAYRIRTIIDATD